MDEKMDDPDGDQDPTMLEKQGQTVQGSEVIAK